MSEYLMPLVVVVIGVALLILVLLSHEPKEIVFYMHTDGDIPNEKVWFTDRHGKPLEAKEEDGGSVRVWWVTVNRKNL